MITAKCYKWSDPLIPMLQHNLKVGKEYEVDCISMGQSHTTVQLKNGKCYNSVFFQFFEDGKEIDIYADKRFNPYLK